jgi:hypothetical protein
MSDDLFSKQDTALRSVGNTHMSQRLDLRQLISDAFRDAYIRFADNDDKQRSEIAEEPVDIEWRERNLRQSIAEKLEEVYSDDFHE